MKISTRNIKEIKSRLEYLYDNFNIDPTDEDPQIGDESIYQYIVKKLKTV